MTDKLTLDEAVEEILGLVIGRTRECVRECDGICVKPPEDDCEIYSECQEHTRAILTRLQPAPQEGGDKPSDTVLKEATGKIMAAKVYAEDGDVPGGLLIAREEAVDILSAAITSASGDKPSDTKKEEQIRNLSCMAGRAFGEVEGGEVNLEYNCAMRVLGETIQHLGVLSGLSIRKPESDVADFIKKNYGLWT